MAGTPARSSLLTHHYVRFFPADAYCLLDVGMEAEGNRAGVGDFLQFSTGGFVGHNFGAERQVNLDPGDAPGWLGAHNFRYVQRAALEFDTVAPGENRHRGNDAGTERISDQIGRRKCFAPALVVGGCVGVDVRTRLEVSAIGAEFAEVINVNRCHEFSS